MRTTPRHLAIIAVALLAAGASACAGGDDDDAASVELPAETEDAADGGSLSAAPSAAGGEGEATPQSLDVTTMQVPGQAIAIEARATLQAEDVRSAVDRITSSVTARGGRVAAADIDYVQPDDEGAQRGSRATLVLEVPPAELPAVADALEELGTVLSFDQTAEDVTEQLADLDTRIANLRASIERVRALYTQAADIDSIVRLEAELTRRETDLEILLASQQALEERVAMSTLTVDVTATPGALDDDRPGIVDAAAAGWGAFIGGLFALVLVLTAAAPFVIAVLVLAVLALWARQLVRRRREVAPPAVSAPRPESEHASRPG